MWWSDDASYRQRRTPSAVEIFNADSGDLNSTMEGSDGSQRGNSNR